MKSPKKRSSYKTTVLGIALTIIGLCLTIYSIVKQNKLEGMENRLNETERRLNETERKLKEEEQKSMEISWQQVERAAEDLSATIKKEFHPNIVLTPGQRGGIFAYFMLAKYYDGDPISIVTGHSIPKENQEEITTGENEVLLISDKYYIVLPTEKLSNPNQKVLIVDDCVFGGSTMKEITKYLIDTCQYKADNIKSCVIITSQHSIPGGFAPDYYWEKRASDFFFPWDLSLEKYRMYGKKGE